LGIGESSIDCADFWPQDVDSEGAVVEYRWLSVDPLEFLGPRSIAQTSGPKTGTVKELSLNIVGCLWTPKFLDHLAFSASSNVVFCLCRAFSLISFGFRCCDLVQLENSGSVMERLKSRCPWLWWWIGESSVAQTPGLKTGTVRELLLDIVG